MADGLKIAAICEVNGCQKGATCNGNGITVAGKCPKNSGGYYNEIFYVESAKDSNGNDVSTNTKKPTYVGSDGVTVTSKFVYRDSNLGDNSRSSQVNITVKDRITNVVVNDDNTISFHLKTTLSKMTRTTPSCPSNTGGTGPEKRSIRVYAGGYRDKTVEKNTGKICWKTGAEATAARVTQVSISKNATYVDSDIVVFDGDVNNLPYNSSWVDMEGGKSSTFFLHNWSVVPQASSSTCRVTRANSIYHDFICGGLWITNTLPAPAPILVDIEWIPDICERKVAGKLYLRMPPLATNNAEVHIQWSVDDKDLNWDDPDGELALTLGKQTEPWVMPDYDFNQDTKYAFRMWLISNGKKSEVKVYREGTPGTDSIEFKTPFIPAPNDVVPEFSADDCAALLSIDSTCVDELTREQLEPLQCDGKAGD